MGDKIFIAYHMSNEGKDGSYSTAHALYGMLKRKGIDCFLRNPDDSNETFSETPQIARQCTGFILVINKGIFDKCETIIQGNGQKYSKLKNDTWLYSEIEGFLTQFRSLVNSAKGKIVCFCEDGEISDEEIGNLHMALANVPPVRSGEGIINWVNKLLNIKSVSNQKFAEIIKKNVSISYGTESNIKVINKEINRCYSYLHQHGNKSLIVLWDVRPVEEINVIHLMYLLKLKELQSAGIDCKIMIFDDTEYRESNARKRISRKTFDRRTSETKEYFETFLGEECCILESDISKHSNHNEYMDFLDKYNKIELKTGVKLSSLITDLNEVFYEQIKIKNAFLLVGENEKKTIWDEVMLNDEAYIPLVLAMTNVNGIDGSPVTPANAENNLISISDFDEEIQEDKRLRICGIFSSETEENKQFAEFVENKIIAPFEGLFNVSEKFSCYDIYDKLKVVFYQGRESHYE